MRLGAFTATVLLAALGAAQVWAEDLTEVPVVVEGKPRSAWGWSLAGAGAPTAAGDVLFVDYMWPVTRGAGETPTFLSSGDILSEVDAGGGARMVGVWLNAPRQRASRGAGAPPSGSGPFRPPTHGAAPAAPDPAGGAATPSKAEDTGVPSLSDEQVASLRSVCVRGWSDAAAAFLARVRSADTCVWLQDNLEEALPHVSESIRYVFATGPIPADLSGLARLKALRFLVLRGNAGQPVDLRPIAGLAELRVLELPGGTMEHVEALGGLRSLRRLNLSGAAGVSDLSWVHGCVSLRHLDVSHTAVVDLSQTGALPLLEGIDAHLAPVQVLPDGPCATLRSLRLGSSVAAPEVLAAFRRGHPTCDLVRGRKDELVAAIDGVDRILIRTGGMCHRDPEGEVVRAVLSTPELLREFVALLEIDDCGGHSGCMCCGGPTFEFYAGARLLAGVSLHHEAYLRVEPRLWRGDVPLTGDSRRALAEWLAQHGEPEPMQNIASARRRRDAARHRETRHLALLGADRLAGLRADLETAGGYSKFAPVFQRFEPDLDLRILLALRLRGAAGDTEGDDVAYAARHSLFADPEEAVLRIGRAAVADDEAHRGFAFWLLTHGGTRGLSDAVLDDVVPPAARRLLADPDPDVRGSAIRGLGDVQRPFAIDLLRRVLVGLRLRDPEHGDAEDEAETTRNVLSAATALAEMGDRTSLPRMYEIAGQLRGWERRRLLEQLQALEQAPSSK